VTDYKQVRVVWKRSPKWERAVLHISDQQRKLLAEPGLIATDVLGTIQSGGLTVPEDLRQLCA
jgi:hypothetical protein